METLITGGTGLVGHYLVTVLQHRGDTVKAHVLLSENTSWLPEGGEQDWIAPRPAGAKHLRRFRISRFMQEACFINLLVLKMLKVNYKTCQRSLLCYETCPENAISVRSYSSARRPL